MRIPSNAPHADAAEAAFVERGLTFVENYLYQTEFPPHEFERYVPIDSSVPASAKFHSYKMWTRVGVAALIVAAGMDIPVVSGYATEYFHQFYRVGAAWQLTHDELLASRDPANPQGPPVNLETESAEAAYEAMERIYDVIAAFGSGTPPTGINAIGPDVGMLGLLNQPSAGSYVIPNGAAGSPLWTSKTPDEIVADVNGINAAMVAATYKVFKPRRNLLPLAQYDLIAGQRMGDGSDRTILSYLEETSPYIGRAKGGLGIESWQYCDGAGAGSTDRMVAYDPDPRKVKMIISDRRTQMPTEYRNLVYRTEVIGKTCGVVAPKPVSIYYADGI